MVVAMAIVTTMLMPPTLRWMLARVPMREDETRRLDAEEAEQAQSLPRMERALVHVDDSRNGQFTSSLAGLFAARHNVLTTLLEAHRGGDDGTAPLASRERWLAAASSAARNSQIPPGQPALAAAVPSLEPLLQARSAQRDAVIKEIAKGYDIAFVGLDQPLSAIASRFEEPLHGLIASFDGPVAILMNAADRVLSPEEPLRILIPTGGSSDSRLAAEVALTLAGASRGTLTALHVFDPREETLASGGRVRRAGMAVLVDIHRLGKRSGVLVKGLTATNLRPDIEIRRAAHRAHYDLVVLGASFRHGEAKFLGTRTLALVQSLSVPVLVIVR